MIKIENFCKDYYDFPHKNPVFSVKNIDITVNDGEICALVGPNGSGKTTIIKAICGFHNPTSGNILITDNLNNSIDTVMNSKLIMENLGYVPEISILPENMKVKEFLHYAAATHNIQNSNNNVDKVIQQCSLDKVLNKKISTLSKGYKQRVSFAQAIIHNPKNLILDEPISGLDPSQIVQMRSLIKELSKDKAILISTHILQEVNSLCSKIFVINDGKLAASGTETEITKQAGANNFEDAFLKLTASKQD